MEQRLEAQPVAFLVQALLTDRDAAQIRSLGHRGQRLLERALRCRRHCLARGRHGAEYGVASTINEASKLDSLDERLLRELAQAGQLRTDELALRLNAHHWTDLCTALDRLVSKGYATVVGPLGRPETLYRVHARGRAALRSVP